MAADDDAVRRALRSTRETRRRAAELAARLRRRRDRDYELEELQRSCDRLRGHLLGDDLPDPEPEITNELWFEFLVEHPELTGWPDD